MDRHGSVNRAIAAACFSLLGPILYYSPPGGMVVFCVNAKAIGGLLKAAGQEWSKHNAARLGAALSYYTGFAIPPLFVIVIFIASLCFDETQVHANRFGITLQPKKHARWILPPEEKPPSQALSSPCIEDLGRKAQLVSELRDEVESLRALVHR